MPTNLPVRLVSPDELRKRFNQGGYWALAQAGTLTTHLQRNGHPSSQRSGEPFCTRSQIVAYHDAVGHRVAVVHQYLRPDGTIGGSGRPDPKLLIEEGVVYQPIVAKPSGP